MEFNQQYNIIFRKNRVLASQIAGQSPAMALTPLDFLIFEYAGQSDSELINRVMSDPCLLALYPNANNFSVQSRFKELIAGQIIVSEPAITTASDILQAENTIEAQSKQADFKAQYQASMNLAFSFRGNKWQFWSALNRKTMACDSKQLLILSMYLCQVPLEVIKKQLNHVLTVKTVEAILSAFVDCGILVKKEIRDTAQTDNVTNDKRLMSDSIQQNGWEKLTVDDRIPVYFVPHMKNHYPLALGVLFSALKNHDNGALLEQFQLIPINYMSPNDFLNGPYRKFKQGVWLFSNYMWSLDVNMQISEAIKKQDARNLTIHGGPSTPEYPQASVDFMNQFQSVDISVHGEGEIAIIEIFEQLFKNQRLEIDFNEQLSEVTGISYKNKSGGITRTHARKRTTTPDFAPSPYLAGYFDDYGAEVDAAILESNRGCPFGCTFCDWGSATNQKVRKFDLDRVKKEIDWIAKKKVRVLWIADANFGLYDRDIELSQHIVETKAKTGFPQEVVVNYTKNSTWRLVEIIKIFTAGGIISQGIISIQTTDDKTLEVINRKNIKTEKYDELTKVFYDLKLPLSTDLMMGLPGITVEAFNKDLQRYIDMDVSVKAYPTQLLPNSPMADPEYIEKYKIKTDENDFLISSFSYSEADLHWMKGMYHMYTIADGYGLMRYVIRFLQWEHSILAVDFMSDMLKYVNQNPGKYASITWAIRYFINDKCMPGGWRRFYMQLADYIEFTYGLKKDSALETVFLVSEASMPDDGLYYPIERNIPHDFTAYFTARTQKTQFHDKPLSHYPPSRFHVSDPNKMVAIDMNYMQYDSHQYFWELHSDVARPKSTSEFAEQPVVA